jgi:hypothetical protein
MGEIDENRALREMSNPPDIREIAGYALDSRPA